MNWKSMKIKNFVYVSCIIIFSCMYRVLLFCDRVCRYIHDRTIDIHETRYTIHETRRFRVPCSDLYVGQSQLLRYCNRIRNDCGTGCKQCRRVNFLFGGGLEHCSVQRQIKHIINFCWAHFYLGGLKPPPPQIKVSLAKINDIFHLPLY